MSIRKIQKLFSPVLTILSSNFLFTLHSSSDVFSISDYLLNVDHHRSNNDVAGQPSKFSSPGSASTSRLPCFFAFIGAKSWLKCYKTTWNVLLSQNTSYFCFLCLLYGSGLLFTCILFIRKNFWGVLINFKQIIWCVIALANDTSTPVII